MNNQTHAMHISIFKCDYTLIGSEQALLEIGLEFASRSSKKDIFAYLAKTSGKLIRYTPRQIRLIEANFGSTSWLSKYSKVSIVFQASSVEGLTKKTLWVFVTAITTEILFLELLRTPIPSTYK